MFIYWRVEDAGGLRAEWDIINRNLEYNGHGTIQHWLVVTGKMEFYDFPETVGNDSSSQLTNSLHHFSEGLVGIPPTRT